MKRFSEEIQAVITMFATLIEVVYDKYNHKLKTRVEVVKALPAPAFYGEEAENPSSYRAMGSWDAISWENPWVAKEITSYNGGAWGSCSRTAVLYIKEDATVEKIQSFLDWKIQVKEAYKSAYNQLQAAIQKEREAAEAVTKEQAAHIKAIIDNFFPGECRVKVWGDGSIEVKEPSNQDGFCGPYNREKAARKQKCLATLKEEGFQLKERFSWNCQDYWKF